MEVEVKRVLEEEEEEEVENDDGNEEEEEVEGSEEEEEEEEETLILVELHGVIDSEIFAQDSFSKFKVLAVDSERPVLQVENFIFSGEYQHTMGTAAFFEEEEKRLKCDPVFCKKPPRMLRYTCATDKKLSMKRVFVTEKSGCKDVKREGGGSGGGGGGGGGGMGVTTGSSHLHPPTPPPPPPPQSRLDPERRTPEPHPAPFHALDVSGGGEAAAEPSTVSTEQGTED